MREVKAFVARLESSGGREPATIDVEVSIDGDQGERVPRRSRTGGKSQSASPDPRAIKAVNFEQEKGVRGGQGACSLILGALYCYLLLVARRYCDFNIRPEFFFLAFEEIWMA
jgi:hypothetical protein